jgi:hypothetical protein
MKGGKDIMEMKWLEQGLIASFACIVLNAWLSGQNKNGGRH